jgi:hypothetical protein
LAVLALAVLVVTAGAAFASDLGAPANGDHGWHGNVHDGHAAGVSQGDGSQGDGPQGDGSQASGHHGHSDDVGSADSGSGSGSGSSDGSGGVTGSSAGIPSAPVEAPAAAASGPAPDAAAAAPDPAPAADTLVAAATDGAGLGTPDAALVAGPDAAVVAATTNGPTNGLQGLGDLPALGSIGAIANRVTDGPSAARALLSTGTGRSLAVIGVLLVAIALFLAVHRRADRGDRKLAAARTGPEVARFR